uniref:MH2 domain-containing protein n=1 Tax=Plectus sambesii TaxID=2011161 RepID=A0A914XBK5_9BILA
MFVIRAMFVICADGMNTKKKSPGGWGAIMGAFCWRTGATIACAADAPLEIWAERQDGLRNRPTVGRGGTLMRVQVPPTATDDFVAVLTRHPLAHRCPFLFPNSPTARMAFNTRSDIIHKLLSSASEASSMPMGSDDDFEVQPMTRSSLVRQRFWTDGDQFFEDNLCEIYAKLPNLEKQIWGKLIVMETNRRTAKAYLRHPVVTVDGTDAEFDGLRIGLGRFVNTQRPAVVEEIFGEIQNGIKIKIDPDGNVWAKRMCHSPVYLKPLYRNRPNDLFVIDQRPVKYDSELDYDTVNYVICATRF